MQNLRRTGKNYGPILSPLWTRVLESTRGLLQRPKISNTFSPTVYIMFRFEDIRH